MAVDSGQGGLRAVRPAVVVLLEPFSVELFHHCETTKFALGPVPVALMITVFARQFAPGKMIDDLYARYNMNRKRKGRLPSAVRPFLVFEIVMRGCRVFDPDRRADVIIYLFEQVGLQASCEIEEE